MSEQAPNWYTPQFNEFAIHAYQASGNSLKNTTTPPTKINGSEMTFRIAGTSEAEEDVKRGDRAKPINPPLDNVKVTTQKSRAFYELYEDDLDQMTVDERKVVAKSGAMALGRVHDKTIVNALRAGTHQIGSATEPMTVDLLLRVANALQSRDVDWNEGKVFVGVDSVSWNRLISYPIFNKMDYVGPDLPMVKGNLAKTWSGMHIFQLPNKTLQVSGSQATCLAWHQSSVGFGYVRQLTTTVKWENEYDFWGHNMRMRIGSKILLNDGVQKVLVRHNEEDIALAASAT